MSARPLQSECSKVSDMTGMQYPFIVTVRIPENDKGWRNLPYAVNVVALDSARAWQLIGQAIHNYMNGPNGKFVLGVSPDWTR